MCIHRIVLCLCIVAFSLLLSPRADATEYTRTGRITVLQQDIGKLEKRIVWVKRELRFNKDKLSDLTVGPILVLSIGLPVGIIAGVTGLIGVLTTISYSNGNIPMSIVGGVGAAVTITSVSLGVVLSNRGKKRKSYLEMNRKLAMAELKSLWLKLALAKEALRQQRRSNKPLKTYQIVPKSMPHPNVAGPALMLGIGCGIGGAFAILGSVALATSRSYYGYFGAEHIFIINGIAAVVGFGIGGITWYLGRVNHQTKRFKKYGGSYTRAAFKLSDEQLRPPPNISYNPPPSGTNHTQRHFKVTFAH